MSSFAHVVGERESARLISKMGGETCGSIASSSWAFSIGYGITVRAKAKVEAG